MDAKAEERRRVILEVLSNKLTATEGAAQLGVSRKTYYEWQARALEAMDEALQDRPGGRPMHPVDPEKTALQEELDGLKRDRVILENRLRIQEAIQQVLQGTGCIGDVSLCAIIKCYREKETGLGADAP